MKIQLISDIHLEYYDEYPGLTNFVNPSATVLVLAGDICYYKHPYFLRFFREASLSFKYVVYVPGNHEYYTKSLIDLEFKTFDAIDNEIRDMLKPFSNVKMLQKQTFVLNNVKFLGTTLWYDTPPTDNRLKNVMYTQHENFVLYKNTLMPDPKQIYDINRSQYSWLSNELKFCKNYFTIVITHYLPSPKCVATFFEKSPDNYLFYSNCDDLLKKSDIWMYGHTHIGKKMNVGKCFVISNPCGSYQEQQKYKCYQYDKECIIDVPSFSSL